MSSEQLQDLLVLDSDTQPIEKEISPLAKATPVVQDVEKPAQASEQADPSLILSQPKKEEAITATSKVLKTRKGLIQQIRTVCRERGIDSKPMNLHRRRKNSLQNILKEQFAEAVQSEMEPQLHPDLQKMGIPEDLNSREKFAVDMAFRLDMTLVMMFERGVSATDKWHGMTCDGFSESLQANEGVVSEIRAAWLEILQEEDNQWILEYVTAPMRLFLAHAYGLMAVLRPKQPKKRDAPEKTMPDVVPRRPTGKLRDFVVRRKESRKEHAAKEPMHKGAKLVVKQV